MKKSPVSYKISKLVKEGYPHKQAIAIALNMSERGQLGPRGGYKKSTRKKPLKKSKKNTKKSPLRKPRKSRKYKKSSSRSKPMKKSRKYKKKI